MLMALDEISESPSCKSDSATSPFTCKRLSKFGQYQNYLLHSHIALTAVNQGNRNSSNTFFLKHTFFFYKPP